MQIFKEARDSRYIDKKGLDKACFQLEKTDGDFKDIAWRRAADRILHYKAFNVAKTPKYN